MKSKKNDNTKLTENVSLSVKARLAEAAKDIIGSRYLEEFSLDKLAADLHFNKFYLLRTFKEETGFTPLQYHNRCRCSKAMELLQQKALSISFIALETGFNSASHFSRVFLREMEMTPSEYRKQYFGGTDEE